MSTVTARFRTIAGTEAALGMVEGRSVIADRPEGKAGGLGLGYSGSQLLALAIGGCFSNTLRKVAHEQGVTLSRVEVDVSVDMDGDPLMTTGARMDVVCETADGKPASEVIAEARRICMVSQSLAKGFQVSVGSKG
jgi:organic hydroperoxide reductase OsmC/OhrA